MTKKSRTREARQRRQKQQRQNQQRLMLVGIVIVAILGIVLVVISNQPTEAVIPTNIEAQFEGLDRSLSEEGYPRLGDPDAPVTVHEYASFSCPGCEAFHATSFDAILERVRLGQVLFVYVPLQTGSIPNAQGAARAALCAGQQGKFWEMHEVLFTWHTQYANTAYSQNRLLAGVNALGLDEGTFTTCFNSQSITNVLDAALGEDVTSTPTIDVNGVTVQTSSGGGIPTTQELLTAIDGATPSNWRPSAGDEADTEGDVEEPEEPEMEETDEADAEDADMEATEEPEVDATEANDADETDPDEPEAETEATEEAGD